MAEAGPQSKVREPGELYDKDVTLNADRYVAMLRDKIFPALERKFPNATGIRLQQDGAACHTGKKKSGHEAITTKLNAIGATCSPPIQVITQSAQSPDFNINDLAFFRALTQLCCVQGAPWSGLL